MKICQYPNCTIPVYKDGDSCLFHKEHKSAEEGLLFWKIINWNHFAGFTQADLILYNTPWHKQNNQQRNYMANKLKEIYDLNFTIEELERDDFKDYKKSVLELRETHKFWWPRTNLMNFEGFVFPKSPEFVVFNPTNFLLLQNRAWGTYCFKNAKSEGYLFFDNYIFNLKANFKNTIFEGNAYFSNTQFRCNCEFVNTKFLHKGGGLAGREAFDDTIFESKQVVFENITNMPNISSVKFSSKSEVIIKNVNFISPKIGQDVYRSAKNQSRAIGLNGNANKFLFLERQFERRSYFINFKEITTELLRQTFMPFLVLWSM